MDFYILLGIERGATLNDIKRAYRRLARKHHPDINPGDRLAEQKFRQIAEAYETLSDPDRRRRYDTSGGGGSASGAPTFGFEGFDFTVSVQGHDAPTFGDLFAEVLHQRETAGDGEPVRGVDLHQTIMLEFAEAIAIHEAALGAKIDVPSLDGPARLRVPPGTQSGQRFRIRERGVVSRDGRRGDLVVEVHLVLPKLLDERSKELLREFGRINGEDVRKDLSSTLHH